MGGEEHGGMGVGESGLVECGRGVDDLERRCKSMAEGEIPWGKGYWPMGRKECNRGVSSGWFKVFKVFAVSLNMRRPEKVSLPPTISDGSLILPPAVVLSPLVIPDVTFFSVMPDESPISLPRVVLSLSF